MDKTYELIYNLIGDERLAQALYRTYQEEDLEKNKDYGRFIQRCLGVKE